MPQVGSRTEEGAHMFDEICSIVILVLRRLLKMDCNNFLMVM
jgi:hypothetical protein